MHISDLVGVWALVRFEVNGRAWRDRAHGRLIYTDTHVSISINGENRGEQANSAFLFYSGTWTISGESEVTHQVDCASDPHRIGKPQVRKVEVNGDLLRLGAAGEFGSAVLEWRRVH